MSHEDVGQRQDEQSGEAGAQDATHEKKGPLVRVERRQTEADEDDCGAQ